MSLSTTWANRRLLLADRDVDAEDALPLLVDDRVERDGGLARLAVANDELALTAADRNHRVDRFEASLKRLAHGLTSDDTRGLQLDSTVELALDRALAVDRLTQCVHDTADERRTDRNLDDATGTLDRVALFDANVGAENRATDVVFLEVEDHAVHATRELEELACHGAFETVEAGDAVTHRQNGSRFDYVDRLLVGSDLLLDDVGNLFSAKLHLARLLIRCGYGVSPFASNVSLSSLSRSLRLPSNTWSPTRVTTPPMSEGSCFLTSTTSRSVTRLSFSVSRA